MAFIGPEENNTSIYHSLWGVHFNGCLCAFSPFYRCWYDATYQEFCSRYSGNSDPVLCKITLRRSKYCLIFSFTIIFEACLINYLRFSVKFINFHISLLRLGYFSYWKRRPKIFGFENVMERGIRKFLTFVICLIASDIFRRNNTEALVLHSQKYYDVMLQMFKCTECYLTKTELRIRFQ